MILALGALHRTPRLDHDQQSLGVCTFSRGLAMLGEHIAGKPDEEIAVMRDVGDDGARFGYAVGWPFGAGV